MAQEPKAIIQKLEGQVDDILGLYDYAEKLHSYDSVHGQRSLNEDQRRRDITAFNTTRGTSGNILQGCSMYGLGTLYLWSRKGASGPLDMARVRACGWMSASVFMVGTTFGCMMLISREALRLREEGQNVVTSTRVQQNEQTHALLRTMKFHLTTRQMNIWDQTYK